jgi:predicted phage terminase large subunit-like protein
VLADKEVVLGPFGYAGQMQQNPIPRSGGSMQVDKMKVQCCAPPQPEEFSRLVRFWDKAISEKKSGCFTVGALVGERVIKTGGNPITQYWILDIRRGRWGGDDRENVIKATAVMDYARYGTRVRVGLEQEPGSAGVRDAQLTCRMLAGFRVVAERPTGDKLTRAEPLANQVSAGSVWVAQAEWNHDFFMEFEYFPHSKYKDQVDATSSAFGMLVDVKAKVRILG